MQLDSSEKLLLEKKIVEILLDQMAQGKLNDDQAKAISVWAEASMKNVQNKQHLSEFLAVLCGKYPFFESVKVIEQGKVDDLVDQEIHDGAIALAQHGKIEEAIKLTKTATE